MYFLKTGSKLTLYMKVKWATLVWCPLCIRSEMQLLVNPPVKLLLLQVVTQGPSSISRCVAEHAACLVVCEGKLSNPIPEIHTGLICNQWCTSVALFTAEASLPDPPVTQHRSCNHLCPPHPLKEHRRHVVTRRHRWCHLLVLTNPSSQRLMLPCWCMQDVAFID